jgi:hypothetical protein
MELVPFHSHNGLKGMDRDTRAHMACYLTESQVRILFGLDLDIFRGRKKFYDYYSKFGFFFFFFFDLIMLEKYGELKVEFWLLTLNKHTTENVFMRTLSLDAPMYSFFLTQELTKGSYKMFDFVLDEISNFYVAVLMWVLNLIVRLVILDSFLSVSF